MFGIIKFLFFIITFNSLLFSQAQVTKVDFLESLNLNYNAAAPLLTKVDQERNKIITVHANSSMVSIIDGNDHSVVNIPVKTRTIQHLKDGALNIDSQTGNVYVIGNKCLHIVFPQNHSSKTFYTNKQYEMIAVDENTGNAFLTGRESNQLAFINIKTEDVKYINWLEHQEPLINLNQTPPPSIRKVISANSLKKIVALDGFTSTLFTFSSESGNILTKRKIELENGARWHYAGYNHNTNHLYVVVETDTRKVVQAAKIDIQNENDVIIKLPELTEGVGVNYNSRLDEVYIPYDNHPSVHVVDFKNGGKLTEIKIPHFGNDASAVDEENNLLYLASWAFGEIEIIDLTKREFIKRIPNLGIIPHTFNMDYNGNNKNLYISIGATAVNGVFGSALTSINTATFESQKVYTGWAPIDLIQRPGRDEFLVFNSEDQFAVVKPTGEFTIHPLPFNYPNRAILNKQKNIYLSYGPHQSYWPTVYIWGAKNGIMKIDSKSLEITDRRIPRLAHELVIDSDGVLYLLQNTWGKEKQFLTLLEDEVREFNPSKRIVLDDEVERETIQRLLKYDEPLNFLYLVKTGEKDTDNGVLQIIDLKEKKIIRRIETGLTPTDLVFDERNIYVSNFDSNTLTIVDKNDYSSIILKTGKQPLKLVKNKERIYLLNHIDNSIQEIFGEYKMYELPPDGLPDNIALVNNDLIISSHSAVASYIYSFNTELKKISLLHTENYHYGETSFDTNNSAFYVRGQFGDSIFEITKIRSDEQGRIWITDYLSGKLFIIKK